MNGMRIGTKTAKTVLQSGEYKKNEYVWRGVWSDKTPGIKENKQ